MSVGDEAPRAGTSAAFEDDGDPAEDEEDEEESNIITIEEQQLAGISVTVDGDEEEDYRMSSNPPSRSASSTMIINDQVGGGDLLEYYAYVHSIMDEDAMAMNAAMGQLTPSTSQSSDQPSEPAKYRPGSDDRSGLPFVRENCSLRMYIGPDDERNMSFDAQMKRKKKEEEELQAKLADDPYYRDHSRDTTDPIRRAYISKRGLFTEGPIRYSDERQNREVIIGGAEFIDDLRKDIKGLKREMVLLRGMKALTEERMEELELRYYRALEKCELQKFARELEKEDERKDREELMRLAQLCNGEDEEGREKWERRAGLGYFDKKALAGGVYLLIAVFSMFMFGSSIYHVHSCPKFPWAVPSSIALSAIVCLISITYLILGLCKVKTPSWWHGVVIPFFFLSSICGLVISLKVALDEPPKVIDEKRPWQYVQYEKCDAGVKSLMYGYIYLCTVVAMSVALWLCCYAIYANTCKAKLAAYKDSSASARKREARARLLKTKEVKAMLQRTAVDGEEGRTKDELEKLQQAEEKSLIDGNELIMMKDMAVRLSEVNTEIEKRRKVKKYRIRGKQYTLAEIYGKIKEELPLLSVEEKVQELKNMPLIIEEDETKEKPPIPPLEDKYHAMVIGSKEQQEYEQERVAKQQAWSLELKRRKEEEERKKKWREEHPGEEEEEVRVVVPKESEERKRRKREKEEERKQFIKMRTEELRQQRAVAEALPDEASRISQLTLIQQMCDVLGIVL